MYFPGYTDRPYLWWLPLPTMIVMLVLIWLLMKRKEDRNEKTIKIITVPPVISTRMPATQPVYIVPIQNDGL
ncbi:hypothetical protein L3Y34_009044 [Caenorhabditis briggsae]|uniref:Uncharacterized protein n=1 Tax=Caenorhabditis briggsae TaxID=6238 RepID=A0AAE9A6C3_CAEBR|nr:hypothetical protein L3Y34_009044 [Caenorhabditis briggsae]